MKEYKVLKDFWYERVLKKVGDKISLKEKQAEEFLYKKYIEELNPNPKKYK